MKTLVTKSLLIIALLTLNMTLPLQMVLGQVGYTEYLRVYSVAGKLDFCIDNKLDSLGETSNYQFKKIAITGSINAKDFRFIKTYLKNIEDIDLSEVNIEEYEGLEGTNEGYNYKYPANEIPLGAFFYWVPVDDGMHSIKNVKLPKTITAIRRNAFARNYNLKSIDIPEGVTSVDYVAFAIDTSLISINFPSTLNTVGSLAFHNCINLDTVVLAAKIPPIIPLDAFEGGGNNRKPYSATLYVPIGTKSQYLNSNWKVFKNIVEKDFSKNIPDYLPKDGLIGWWPFNGNADDVSGNDNDGTVNGATLTTDRFGNTNKAYSFNKNDISVNLPNSQFNSDFSISVWVFLDSLNSTTTYPTFITQENSYLTFQCVNYPIGSDPKANFYFLNDYGQQIDGDVQANVFYNNWMNLVLVNSSGINHLYINGTLIAKSDSISTIQGKGAGNFLKFGNGDELPQELFIGKLDDIGIWNRALTEQEITVIFKGDNIPISDCKELNGSLLNGLVAYYPFCGNANDESGNGHDGTVNGATLTTDRYGDSDKSYSFDTIQNIILNNTQSLNPYPLTISLWYKVSNWSSGENSSIFFKYASGTWNGFGITLNDYNNVPCVASFLLRNTNNRILGYYNEPSFDQTNINQNQWYHYVFTVDSSGGKIYVDGQLIAQKPWTGNAGNTASNLPFQIGGKADTWFRGQIDDIGIWNRALTQQEIEQLYGSSICNTPPPDGNKLQTFNEGNQLFNLSIIGENIKWYNDSIGGSPISEDTFLEEGIIYYASQTQNGCESSQRLAIKVNLNKITASSTTVCLGSNVTLTVINNQIPASYTIGSHGPAGGYVFYDKGFESNGWRYIEAAPNDIVNSSWGCYDVNIAGTSLAIGSGFSNTNLIVNGCTNNDIAAKRCLDFSINGYDDWFLPSQNEFAEIYKNLIVKNIGNFSTTPIPATGNLYWTSTQLTAASGSHCNLDNGQFYQYGKVYELYVRPVRYFNNDTTQKYLWSTGEKTASINVTPTQTSTYWLEMTSNGITSRDSITINVTNTPAPTGALSQSFNPGATVANLQATGTQIKWYSSSTSGDSLQVFTPLADGLIYYASQTLNECESQDRLEVKVIITGETVTDIDGNIYHTVKIGNQTWMVENLKTTRYRNGEEIPMVTDNNSWINLTTGAQCNYNNDAAIGNKFGKLFNWYAVNDSRNIAPTGWHMPTDAEWITLQNYLMANLGSSSSVSKALASKTDWTSSNIINSVGNDLSKNNFSGFTALPGGYRVNDGNLYGIGDFCGWWSSSKSPNGAWSRSLYYNSNFIRGESNLVDGFYVRCIKDNVASTANAGLDQTVTEGDLVTLNGLASSDLDGDTLTYFWSAPEGILLNSVTDANPTFIAPEVTSNTEYKFYLVVNDKIVNSESDSVIIIVKNTSNCPQHFHPLWEGTSGVDHMNINVIDAKFDGLNLDQGDEIGIFDGNICVGFGKVTKTIDQQNILSIKVSRNDGTGNGYTSGHEVSYIIWDCSATSEYTVNDVQCFNNHLNPITCVPFEAGATAFVKLSGVGVICQTLHFRTGWNIFSVPGNPAQAAIDTIFQPAINNNSLVKIQDEGGNSMEDWGIFGGWTNAIGNINPTEGYKIKVGYDDSLEICGTPVKFPFAIPLNIGWNIMGYPQTSACDGMDVVQQLIDRSTVIKVQDELGNSIEDWGIFGGWTNGIGDFTAGEGYKIKVNIKDTLWITDSCKKSTTILLELVATTHFEPKYEGNGVDHMNIHFVSLPANILKSGDELAIFDGNTCVGAVTLMPYHLKNKAVSIAASATDNGGMAGFAEGNPFTLKLWDSQKDQEFNLEPEIVKGTSTFAKQETTIASLEKYATTGLSGIPGSNITKIKCYPNPFSDKVTIEIDLATDAQVQVEVLNQLGQRVKMMVTKQQLEEGLHKFEWDGSNTGTQAVSPGIYYLKVNIDGNSLHKKIVYSK